MNIQPRPSPVQSLGIIALSGDHIHNNLKNLEQLLDSSLATAGVIRFSGNTLADILTPRARDTLYALTALNVLVTNFVPKVKDIPTRSAFSGLDIRKDYRSADHPLPHLSSSSLVNPPTTCRINISISVEYSELFLWVGFAAVISSFLAFFIISLPRFSSCGKGV